MPRTFSMPELAESVVEGEVVQWLVGEGEPVALDQPLVEVMTDKVTVEIPSPFEGVLIERLAAVGDVVPVGGPLARYQSEAPEAASDEDGRAEPAAAASPSTDPPASTPAGSATSSRTPSASTSAEASAVTSGAASAAVRAATSGADEDDGSSLTLFTAGAPMDDGPLPKVRKPARASSGREPSGPAAQARAEGAAAAPDAASDGDRSGRARGPWGRPLAVPAARKRARELGVPIEAVLGSGPHGRVRPSDVEEHGNLPNGEAAAANGVPGVAATATDAAPDAATNAATSAATSATAYAGTPLRPPPDGPEEVRTPLRGMRRTIAKQMLDSHLSTARALQVGEADVSRLVDLRARLKPRAAARGVRLSFLPFVMKALVLALAEYPMLNARMDEETGEIVRFRDVHLGLAVATERGLVVPVIRDASRRTLLDLAAETSRLAGAAREGRLAPDEVRGGTFSVTNIGTIGGLFSLPVINAPEAAILGVHAIKKRPVVLDDDRIVARSMLYLSVAFDHRLADGAEVARFTNLLIDVLEEPEALLLDA